MWRFETESAEAVKTWLSGPASGLGAVLDLVGSEQGQDLYADTQDRFFERSGYALRLRRSEERLVAGLEPVRAGLLAFADVEVASEAVGDLARASEPLGERVRAVAGPRRLRAVAHARTRREAFRLRLEGRPCATVEIEEIDARRTAGGSSTLFARVVISATEQGDPALSSFVVVMESACGLSPADRTVGEAVLRRLGVAAPPPFVPGATAVPSHAPTGALAYAVIRRHLGAFLRNEPGTRLGADPEVLHDMRVASRRLRAAFALFAEALPARAPSLRRRLGRIGRALGEVRDLDVQAEQLGEFLNEGPVAERLALEAYLAAVAVQRDGARRRMLRVLDSRGYGRLVESLMAFVEREPRRRPPAARLPALASAPDRILSRHRRSRRIGDRLAPDSPAADWHKLRIELKRLRYAIEFHGELYGEKARRVIETLTGLQDLLGLHQDAQVAMAHLEDVCGARGKRLPRGAGFVMGRIAQRYAQRAEDLRRAFPKLYRRAFGKRWRSLRDAMESSRPRA